VFFNSAGIGAAPVICYESIYGEFVSDYVKNGATFIAIITNDAWWGNTPGHRQHLQYASLRAIETRKSVARSANTGISGFINQRGDILAASEYWVQDAMKGTIMSNDILTFYTKHGDFLAKGSPYLAILLIGYTVVLVFIRRKTKSSGKVKETNLQN
ncbi:MAG: nitrilase-related carbon-nitrogen hydrolase, partial [Cytophagaceae bacterium]